MRKNSEIFRVIQVEQAELSVIWRKFNDDNRDLYGEEQFWDDFWQRMDRFDAIEESARRESGWFGCIWGRDKSCPPDATPTCSGCVEAKKAAKESEPEEVPA